MTTAKFALVVADTRRTRLGVTSTRWLEEELIIVEALNGDSSGLPEGVEYQACLFEALALAHGCRWPR